MEGSAAPWKDPDAGATYRRDMFDHVPGQTSTTLDPTSIGKHSTNEYNRCICPVGVVTQHLAIQPMFYERKLRLLGAGVGLRTHSLYEAVHCAEGATLRAWRRSQVVWYQAFKPQQRAVPHPPRSFHAPSGDPEP
jgi:hypothetical protein